MENKIKNLKNLVIEKIHNYKINAKDGSEILYKIEQLYNHLIVNKFD